MFIFNLNLLNEGPLSKTRNGHKKFVSKGTRCNNMTRYHKIPHCIHYYCTISHNNTKSFSVNADTASFQVKKKERKQEMK